MSSTACGFFWCGEWLVRWTAPQHNQLQPAARSSRKLPPNTDIGDMVPAGYWIAIVAKCDVNPDENFAFAAKIPVPTLVYAEGHECRFDLGTAAGQCLKEKLSSLMQGGGPNFSIWPVICAASSSNLLPLPLSLPNRTGPRLCLGSEGLRMANKRPTFEQIVSKIRLVEVLMRQGMSCLDANRQTGVVNKPISVGEAVRRLGATQVTS
ncbi:MAG: hypothetical protein AAGH83_01975 [Pseudomonadota bacterium]